MKRSTTRGLLPLVGLVLGACGVGANVNLAQNATIPGGTNAIGTPTPAEDIDGVSGYGFTIYDQTGFMLAGMGNAAKHREARNKAAKSAALRGESEFEYEVQYDPPTPGMWTSFSYNKGSNDDFNYSEADVRLALGKWREFGGTIAMNIGFFQASYERKDQSIGFLEYEWDAFALPIAGSFRYPVHPMAQISGNLGIDLLMPVIGGLTGEPNKFGYEAGLRVESPVTEWLVPYAGYRMRQAPVGGGEQRINDSMFTFGVTVIYSKDGGP